MCSFGIPVGSSRIVLNLIFALLNSLSDSNLVPFTPKTALIRLALKALFLVTGISTSLQFQILVYQYMERIVLVIIVM